MTSFYDEEKQLFLKLRKSEVESIEHPEAAKIFKEARKLSLSSKHEKASVAFGALALLEVEDFNFPLRAAQSYQKADLPDEAARWFLGASLRYAQKHYTSQALATLKLYHNLKPNDSKEPKRVYRILRSHGESGEDILPLLSSKDQAAHKLRPGELFTCLDDKNFYALLSHMIFRKIDDGTHLTQMGETASSLFFVIKGQIGGYLSFNKKRSHLGTVGAGDICGETSYFTGGSRTADMIAVGDAEVLELPYTMLDMLKKNSPKFEEHLEKLYRKRMLVVQLSLTSAFESIPAVIREQIAQKMTTLKISAGDVLMNSSDTEDALYLVRAGTLAVNLEINNSERLLKTLETGCIVGEVSLVVGGKRTATIRAVTDCILMKLNGEDYNNIYESSPELQAVIDQRKRSQMTESMGLVKSNKNIKEGDETCEVLLRDIWQSTTGTLESLN
ncbi:MAG: cyclic nucleotide-binding domain-containing protein [Ghiorsea sp.]